MKKVLSLLTFLLISFTYCNGKELTCEVQFGLYCRVLFQDMENDTSVTFNVGAEEINQIMTVSIIASRMKDVPSGIISSFVNITNLILRENSLEQWKPEYVAGGEQLKLLYITENPISNLDDGAFINTPNLLTLAISFTNISLISPGAFEGLTKLENLDLNNNPIGDNLTVDTFNPVRKTVKRLNLAEIGVDEFPTGFFDGFEQLDTLLVKDNLFKELNAEILPKSLKKIEITKNVKIHNAPSDLEIVKVRKARRNDEL